MSKTFVFDRWDIGMTQNPDLDWELVGTSDGLFIKSQDAIDRSMSLEAKIRVLELQLKETHGELIEERNRLMRIKNLIDE